MGKGEFERGDRAMKDDIDPEQPIGIGSRGSSDGERTSAGSAARTEVDPLRRARFESGDAAEEDPRLEEVLTEVDRARFSDGPALFQDDELVGGRYRILRFLAEGGMGAVYEVEDEELGGRLALKAILPELGYRANSVGRFRREIQLSRKVTHPNVCRVFDVGKHQSKDHGFEVLFLTMELLKGETLSERLKRDGALPPSEALAILGQVAAALQAAHDVGVVHRDLKASNVMLETAPDGGGVRAVVTDFGLSRSVFEDPTQSGITASGHMVGTPAYAAPEQIAGKPPTPACDIYSLGLVLYEMLRGKLPYDDDSPYMVAIQRLQGEPLPRLSESGVTVEDRWEAAIRRALAIDPAERFGSPLELVAALRPDGVVSDSGPVSSDYGSLSQVPSESGLPTVTGNHSGRWLLVLLLVLVAGVGAWWLRPPPETETSVRSLRVAVLPAEAPRAEGEFIGTEVEVAIERALVKMKAVRPVALEEVAPLGGGVSEVIRATAAREALVSRVQDRGSEWAVTLKRVLADGGVVWAEDFAAPKGDARLLANAVAAHLQRGYDAFETAGEAVELKVTPEDYEAYLRWHRILSTRPPGTDWEEVAKGLAEVRMGSPSFVDAYLMEARILRYLYTRSEDGAYLERAYQLAALAQDLAPSDPRTFLVEVHSAAAASDFDRAEGAIARLESRHPGEVEVDVARALVAERRGTLSEAVRLRRQIVERRGGWASLMDLARVEVLAGDYDAARTHLDQVLGLSPANQTALRKLGELELEHGDLDEATRIFEEIVAGGGDSLRTNLGLCHLLRGDYPTAVAELELVLGTDPDDPLSLLNLADAVSLSGDETRARSLYEAVLQVLEPYRDSPRPEVQLIRAQALAQLGRRSEAVVVLQHEAVQNARLASSWYTTALVFTLVGDTNSAAAYAERALQAGMNPRWFSLPWFEPIRADLDAVAASLPNG